MFTWSYVGNFSNAGSAMPITYDDHACQPFQASNAYRTQTILGVMDYATLWPFMDATKYPATAPLPDLQPTREIYSDPFGTADDTGLIVLPLQPPTQPISQLTVWRADRIDAVQLTYPAGSGRTA